MLTDASCGIPTIRDFNNVWVTVSDCERMSCSGFVIPSRVRSCCKLVRTRSTLCKVRSVSSASRRSSAVSSRFSSLMSPRRNSRIANPAPRQTSRMIRMPKPTMIGLGWRGERPKSSRCKPRYGSKGPFLTFDPQFRLRRDQKSRLTGLEKQRKQKRFLQRPDTIDHQRRSALPQAIPAPMAIMAMRSPGFSIPARLASSSEIGSEALEVLP